MEKHDKQIKTFLSETSIQLSRKEGKPYYRGTLDLRGTAITALPDNLIVGGYLDLRGTAITDTSRVRNQLSDSAIQKIENKRNPTLTWEQNGKTYIKIDNILSRILSKHGKVYHVQNVGKTNTTYLVTDGENRWAHGDTIKEAREDLIYKISSRDTSKYKNLSLDSELTFEECITCYRVVTGACAAGTRDYIENRLPKPHKTKYTIREMIRLTKGEYNATRLEQFFT